MKHIPNIITLANLFCGCLALVAIFSYSADLVPYLIFICFLLDYADGTIARLLNIKSEMGKELDSLADVVSFGVVPGAIMFYLLSQALRADGLPLGDLLHLPQAWIAFTAFLIPVFSAYRLAKFNLDKRQSYDFIGLPTPSSAGFVIGLLWIYQHDTLGLQQYFSPFVLAAICAVLSYLLICELPMFSMKFRDGGKFASNWERYIALVITVITLGVFQFAGFCFLVTGYLLYSLVRFLMGSSTAE